MRYRKCASRSLFVLVLAIVLLSAASAGAVDIHGRSSTQYLWYNDPIDGGKQKDLSEYLMVSMTGLDDAGKLSLQGYARASYDLKDGGGVEDRIYYLFADYKGLLGKADVRVGRQFVNLSAGSALLDGVQVDIKNAGPVGFILAGGRDIRFGELDVITSHASAVGVAAYLAGLKKTELDVSYLRSFDYSDVSRDIAGVSLRRYFLESLKVYADARYDLTAEVFNEVLAGIKYFPVLDLMMTAEYFESYPTFDATSLYSVFAVEKYQEAVLGAEYTLSSAFDLSLAYYHEEFGSDARAAVYQIGLRHRPSAATTIGLFHDGRRGYGGTLDGYKVYAEHAKPGVWKGAVGIDYDAYERDDMTGSETAKRYWIAGRYVVARSLAVSARVEDNVNVNYSKDMRGRVTFDYDF